MAGGPHSTSAAGENGAVSEEFIISEEFIARTCLPATRREGRAVLGPVEGDLGLVEDAGRRRHEDPRPLTGTPRARSQRPQIPAGFRSGAMAGHAGGGEHAGHRGGRSRGAGISAGVCLQTEHPGHRPAPGPAPAPSGSRGSPGPLLSGRGDFGRKHPALSPPGAAALTSQSQQSSVGTEKDGDHVMALPAGRAAVWGEFPTFQLFQALGERCRRLPALGRSWARAVDQN